MNVERLVKLVKILRNAPPEKAKHFSMDRFAYGVEYDDSSPPCGTPACALGWYASNKKQNAFRLTVEGKLLVRYGNHFCRYNEYTTAMKHFEISEKDVFELFSADGCNKAKSTKQAANYIERFIIRKLKEEMRVK